MRRLRTNIFVPIWLKLVQVGTLAGLAILTSSGWGAPANDNFANAQVITGPAGNVSGNNLGATTEPGEPPTIAGAPAGASVWYSWTAPATGPVTFNTFLISFSRWMAAAFGSWMRQGFMSTTSLRAIHADTNCACLQPPRITAAIQ